jgi:phospholipid transport system substrate-binding protein
MAKHMIQSVFGFLFMVLWVSSAHAETSPVPMLQTTAQQIIDTLKANQSHLKTDNHIINQAIQKYLLPHVDIEGMSRSVLGRQVWTKASASEKQAFSQVFTQLIIRTYASPLAEYSGETVNFMPVRGAMDGHFIRVNSVINRPNGQRIPLSYNLVLKAGDWKIYDLSVEGISLLQSFKLQFANILQQGSIQDLINQMRAHKRAA